MSGSALRPEKWSLKLSNFVLNIPQHLTYIFNHKRMAYTAFWTEAPPGRKKIFQKEQPVMVKKPSLSIHIEFYII